MLRRRIGYRPVMRRLATALLCLILSALPARADCVVLLHGLARSDSSMWLMQETLQLHGYRVINHGYPSDNAPIEALIDQVGRAVNQCGFHRIHFVTHSLGGILVRAWLRDQRPAIMGRVVMLAPPNQGSEIADMLAEEPRLAGLVEFVSGPAALQLGTDAGSVPNSLGPVDFELGVIAGNRFINPLGALLIDGPHDGTVSVESTQVEGMADHIVLPTTHALIMMNPVVIAEVLEFLRWGAFDHGITLPTALRKLASP